MIGNTPLMPAFREGQIYVQHRTGVASGPMVRRGERAVGTSLFTIPYQLT